MTNQQLAEAILALVGGVENVKSVTHCITRLRFVLHDEAKADTKQIEALPGILGVKSQGMQYQVVVGTHVSAVYNELVPYLKNVEADKSPNTEQKQTLTNRLLQTLSAILVPSLSPIIGGGMLKGFLFLLVYLGWLQNTSGTYQVLNIAADCMFYFFPFLLALSAAKRFKTNEYIALALAGALFYPGLAQNLNTPIEFLSFLPIPRFNYSGSVIPIILSVWLLSYLHRAIERRVPQLITIIFTPLLTLLIMIPLQLAIVAPAGFYLGEYIAIGIEWFTDTAPWLAGFVIGGTRPLLVLVGMHHAVRPLSYQQISTYGYSTLNTMNLLSTIAQASAAFGVYLACKQSKMKQISLSAATSGFLGVTEPALYGVLIPYRQALWAAMIGGGVASAIAVMMGGRGYAIAMPSVLSVPTFFGQGFLGIAVGLAISFILSAGLAWLLCKKQFSQEGV